MFEPININTIEQTIDNILQDNVKVIDQITQEEKPTWHNIIQVMEGLDARLGKAWSPVSHLNAVMSSKELRAVYHKTLPKITDYYARLGSNKALYYQYVGLSKSTEFTNLDYAQKKVIVNALRDFTLSGVALNENDREIFLDLQTKLSKLANEFKDNVLDATNAWSYVVTDHSELKGLPESAILAASEAAKKVEKAGYLFGLDYPSYHAVMTYAENADLREKLYKAYVTRAPMNGSLINQILAARSELAKLLGFHTYSDLSLQTKMVKTPKAVFDFLDNMVSAARGPAQEQYDYLKQFSKTEYGRDLLNPWDLSFYSEKLRQKRYDISQDALKVYFPIEKVLAGLFEITHRLYGVSIKEKTGVEIWDPAVRFFEIFDEQGVLKGKFYVDLYARANKQGGAWMDSCQNRRRLDSGEIEIPIAYLVANFAPPIPDVGALLTHDEVQTLFHEFGHGLHHMLTKIDYSDVAGIHGVPWDAVELPSQFMENFCWDEAGLALISSHYKTGEPLSLELLNKLRSAKNFHSAIQLVRQLEFAWFDFYLHDHKPDVTLVQKTLDRVHDQISVIPVPDYNCFQNSFTHIFGGGYAAGYYSYLWAEVLSADVYAKFEEDGVFNGVGRDFLHKILEEGGAKDPSELFFDFRGREPSFAPFFKHKGLDVKS